MLFSFGNRKCSQLTCSENGQEYTAGDCATYDPVLMAKMLVRGAGGDFAQFDASYFFSFRGERFRTVWDPSLQDTGDELFSGAHQIRKHILLFLSPVDLLPTDASEVALALAEPLCAIRFRRVYSFAENKDIDILKGLTFIFWRRFSSKKIDSAVCFLSSLNPAIAFGVSLWGAQDVVLMCGAPERAKLLCRIVPVHPIRLVPCSRVMHPAEEALNAYEYVFIEIQFRTAVSTVSDSISISHSNDAIGPSNFIVLRSTRHREDQEVERGTTHGKRKRRKK